MIIFLKKPLSVFPDIRPPPGGRRPRRRWRRRSRRALGPRRPPPRPRCGSCSGRRSRSPGPNTDLQLWKKYVMNTRSPRKEKVPEMRSVIYRAVCLRELCFSPPPLISLRKDNKRITPVAISFHKRMLAFKRKT